MDMLIGFGLGVVSLLVVLGLIVMVRSIFRTKRNTNEIIELNRRIEEVYNTIDDRFNYLNTELETNKKELVSKIDSNFDKQESKIKALQEKK